MGQSDRAFDEIALDSLSNGIEAGVFLASLASVFFLSALLLIAASLVQSLSGLSLAAPVTAGTIVLSAAAWAWSIAQIRPLPIFAGALLWGAGLGGATSAQVLRLPTDADWFVKGFVIAATLVALAFALRILLDAWRLVRIGVNTRTLVAAAAPDHVRLASVLARIVGIHPICAWLPSARRRILAAVLFIAVTFVVSLSAAFTVYAVVNRNSAEAAIALDACFSAGGGPRASVVARCGLAAITVFALPMGIVALLATAAPLRWLARTSARTSLESIASTDGRPSILFLRSFHDDQVKLHSGARGAFHRLLSLGEPRPRFDHLLFEEATPIGPVVAIGMPNRPAPFGAARVFVSDSQWKDAVAGIAGAAHAIVVVLDDTDGVLWELAHIRAAGHVQKTLFVLPPRLASAADAQRLLVRELSADGPIAQTLPDIKPHEVCIGWYRTGAGRLKALTATSTKSTSYVAALRLALRSSSPIGLRPIISQSPRSAFAKVRGALIDIAASLVIIMPIAILVSMTMPHELSNAKQSIARAQIAGLVSAVEAYRLDTGELPGSLDALVRPPARSPRAVPYLQGNQSLLDPWNRPFRYHVNVDGTFLIESLGRDGQRGGAGEDADLANRL
jgi:general secretion pathway protein G